MALVAACEQKKPPQADAGTPAATSASSSIDRPDASPAPLVEAGATDTRGSTFDCTDTSAPRAGKSIGHTSVVFKLDLASGKKVAWKPNAKKVKGRYKGEIAAYRFAEALGIHNVLPACLRVFDTTTAAGALARNGEAAKVFAEEAIVEQGKVHGAVIPWIDGLQFWPLEKEPLRSEARGWLVLKGSIPMGSFDLARQTSILVSFDFLTGNWDRYSGENIGLEKAGMLVLFIDNDAAFMESPPKELVARNKTNLEATDRFSRSFVTHVRALDERRIAAALGDETPGTPLVTPAVVALVAARARELLSVVDAKVTAHGEAETLYFP